MSYRRKHNPPKTPKKEQPSVFPKEYRNPGVERMLSTRILYSGQPYQRTVKPREVNRLIRQWNPRKLRSLIVSFRDGKYYVVDGQHRLAALRKMNGDEDVFVACLVYDDLTYEEEAAFYKELDQADRPLSRAESTKADIESGMDPKITEINRLLVSHGFKWALDKSRGGSYEITATQAIISAYDLLGPETFDRMLGILADTWKGDPASTNAAMLSGVALFLKTYETELDDAAFVQRLGVIEAEEIVRRSKVDFSTSSRVLRVGRVLLEKYNSGRRSGKKLPYRFNN